MRKSPLNDQDRLTRSFHQAVAEEVSGEAVKVSELITQPQSKAWKQNGGKRPGAGRPKGKLNAKTLEKTAVRDAFNQLVMRSATRLFNAQLDLALGEKQLFVKYFVGEGKDRKSVVQVVTDPELIKEYLIDDGATLNASGTDEYYYISTKPADNRAIQALLDRALGRAPDKLEITGGFFTQHDLTIKVVGSTHDVIDIGEEGQIIEPGADAKRTPRLGDQDPQPPASS